MNKLDELMELSKAIDVIIEAAEMENERTVTSITEIEEVLWNEMWNDIDKMYEKYLPICCLSTHSFTDCISTVYWQERTPSRGLSTYFIRLYKDEIRDKVVITFWNGGYSGYGEYVITRETFNNKNTMKWLGIYVTNLLINWSKVKAKLEENIANQMAKSIKEKANKTKNKIEQDNDVLDKLIKEAFRKNA